MLRYTVNPEYSNLSDFVAHLSDIYENEGEVLYDGRNQVRLFVVDGEKVVVKRYRKPLFHQQLYYTLTSQNKAKKAYNCALEFLKNGIDTPKPIGYVEEYHSGLLCTYFFASTFCGDPDMAILRDGTEGHEDLVEALARFLAKMHEKGIIHGDTNLTNFLYRKDDSEQGLHVTTIDINRTRFVSGTESKACLESLFRLTHVRATLRKIVARYAQLRGMDVDGSIKVVEDRLTRFERRKNLKKKLLGRK